MTSVRPPIATAMNLRATRSTAATGRRSKRMPAANATPGIGVATPADRYGPETRQQGERTMSLFDQLTNALGGSEPIERFAAKRANFDDPQSKDFEHWNQMIGAAPPRDAEEAFT